MTNLDRLILMLAILTVSYFFIIRDYHHKRFTTLPIPGVDGVLVRMNETTGKMWTCSYVSDGSGWGCNQAREFKDGSFKLDQNPD